MSQFVVLQHEDSNTTHWDFMLRIGPSLATWALSQRPEFHIVLDAEQLPDHRLEYLDYEGPISDDRGTVSRWDQGTYELEERTASKWIVLLSGTHLTGRLTLEQTDSEPSRWQFRLDPSSPL